MAKNEELSFDDRMRSADRLRSYRKAKGWTQEEFAHRLGLSLQGYKMVERGTNNVSVSLLRKLHDEAAVSADYILYGERDGSEHVWKSIQDMEDSDKMDIMLKLLLYFCYEKPSKDLPEDFKLYDFLQDMIKENRKRH